MDKSEIIVCAWRRLPIGFWMWGAERGCWNGRLPGLASAYKQEKNQGHAPAKRGEPVNVPRARYLFIHFRFRIRPYQSFPTPILCHIAARWYSDKYPVFGRQPSLIDNNNRVTTHPPWDICQPVWQPLPLERACRIFYTVASEEKRYLLFLVQTLAYGEPVNPADR